jgi:hypothetical protein
MLYGSAFTVQSQNIIKLDIPREYQQYKPEQVIKSLLAVPRLSPGYFISSADTTVVSLLTCAESGVYKFGPSYTDHSSAKQIIVVKQGTALYYAKDSKSYSEHRKLLKRFWQDSGRGCNSNKIGVILRRKVLQAAYENRRVVSSDVF